VIVEFDLAGHRLPSGKGIQAAMRGDYRNERRAHH
jgi:hypothetical protein